MHISVHRPTILPPKRYLPSSLATPASTAKLVAAGHL